MLTCGDCYGFTSLLNNVHYLETFGIIFCHFNDDQLFADPLKFEDLRQYRFFFALIFFFFNVLCVVSFH